MKKLVPFIVFLLLPFISVAQTDTSSVYAELKNRIVNETEAGGQYDFFTRIKGHEYESVQIKPNVYDTKLGLALMIWGRLNYELGIKTLDDAYAIFSAYKARPINSKEKEYIRIGFNKGLEK